MLFRFVYLVSSGNHWIVIDSCVDIIHCLFLDWAILSFLFISRTTLGLNNFVTIWNSFQGHTMHFDECKENGFLLEKNVHDNKKYSPYFSNHFSVMRLPLLTTVTLGSWRSCLQNCTSSPKYAPRFTIKGSPPAKLTFSIPVNYQIYT